MIEAELPDGRILEFPEGTNPAVIQQKVKELLGVPSQTGAREFLKIAGQGTPIAPVEPSEFSPIEPAEPPIPDPVVPPQLAREKEPQPSQLSDHVSKATFIGALATVGGLGGGTLGAAAGGVGALPGAAVGGALGASAGSALFDNVDQFLRSIGVFEAPVNPGTFGQQAVSIGKRAIEEGVTDLAFTVGTVGVGRAIKPILPAILKGGRPLLGRLLGVSNEDAAKITARAQDLDIPLAAIDVSKRAKGFADVVSIFPFVGTPLRKNIAGRPVQVKLAAERILNEIAPNALAGDMGADLIAAASAKHAKFRAISGELYGEYGRLLSEAGNPSIIPTKTAKAAVSSIVREIQEGTVGVVGGVAGAKKALPEALNDLVARWGKLPKHVSITQYRGLTKELGALFDIFKKDKNAVGAKWVQDIKRGLEADLQQPAIELLENPEVGSRIISALEGANSFYSRNIPIFKSTTAKKFLLSDRRMFKAGAKEPGTRTADEIAKVFQNPSPDRIKQLTKLTGPKTVARYMRSLVQNAYEGSFRAGGEGGQSVFDPFKFERSLGLTGPDRLRREGLRDGLKLTNLKIEELDQFVEVSKRALAFNAPEASKFIARRAILGGSVFAGLAAGGGAFLGLETGLAGTILMLAAGRRMSRIISDPQKLRMMIRVLDDTEKKTIRRAALVRIGRLLADPEPIVEIGPIGP